MCWFNQLTWFLRSLALIRASAGYRLKWPCTVLRHLLIHSNSDSTIVGFAYLDFCLLSASNVSQRCVSWGIYPQGHLQGKTMTHWRRIPCFHISTINITFWVKSSHRKTLKGDVWSHPLLMDCAISMASSSRCAAFSISEWANYSSYDWEAVLCWAPSSNWQNLMVGSSNHGLTILKILIQD